MDVKRESKGAGTFIGPRYVRQTKHGRVEVGMEAVASGSYDVTSRPWRCHVVHCRGTIEGSKQCVGHKLRAESAAAAAAARVISARL